MASRVGAISLQSIVSVVSMILYSGIWEMIVLTLVLFCSLLCFQLPINPLHDRSLSEYAYRDRIVNRLIEDVFLDVNNAIRMRT